MAAEEYDYLKLAENEEDEAEEEEENIEENEEPTFITCALTPSKLKHFCGSEGLLIHIAFTIGVIILVVLVLAFISPRFMNDRDEIPYLFSSIEEQCEKHANDNNNFDIENLKPHDLLKSDVTDSMSNSINSTIDPCDDFYEYACGGWERNNPIPKYTQEWNVFSILEKRTSKIISDTMSKDANDENDITAYKQAKIFYKKCVDLDFQNETLALNIIWKTLEYYGGWPILHGRDAWNSEYFSWMKSVSDLMKRFKQPALLNIYSHQDPAGVLSNNTIDISVPTFVTSPALKYKNPNNIFPHNEVLNGHPYEVRDYIVSVVKELLVFKGVTSFNDDYLREQAFDIILLQHKLNRIIESPPDTYAQFRSYHGFNNNYGKMTLGKLQSMIDHFVGPNDKVKFAELLKILYATSGVEITDSTHLYIMDINYVLEVISLVQSVGVRTLSNYLQFQMVQAMLPMSTKKLRDLYEVKMYGGRISAPRNEICADVVFQKFKFAITQHLIKTEHGSACEVMETQNEIRNMFNQIKFSFRRLKKSNSVLVYVLDNLVNICVGFPDWIYDDIRVQSEYAGLYLNQFTYIEQILSYNEWYTNRSLRIFQETLSINQCEWSYAPADLGAFSDITRLKIYLSIGLLQRPFFTVGNLNSARNYGSLGTIIGHELVHALQRFGWVRNETDILTSEELCLESQYSNFSVEGFPAQNIFLNGEQTLRENLADNAGLILAFEAFRQESNGKSNKSITKINQLETTTIGEITNEQIFFLGFAQNWCGLYTLKGLQSDLKSDVHSPGKYRVLGTLQNFKEFATAWNCPIGSNMNPDPSEGKKCIIF